jgi:hypothetical protein
MSAPRTACDAIGVAEGAVALITSGAPSNSAQWTVEWRFVGNAGLGNWDLGFIDLC